MRIDWDVPLRMDDGVVLSANVFRPSDACTHPVIISYTAYGKDLDLKEGYPGYWELISAEAPGWDEGITNKYQAFEIPDPERWVADGYAVVRVDSRGIGRSEGSVDNFSDREARDYYACIEWAGTQPWSNGRVATIGMSYHGSMQWRVGALRPPHLTAMCVIDAWADFYRDRQRHGGILTPWGAARERTQLRSIQNGLGTRGLRNPHSGLLVSGDIDLDDDQLEARMVGHHTAKSRAHELDDSFYREHSAELGKIEVPFLSVSSWGSFAVHLRGNIEAFVQAPAPEKWLVVTSGMSVVSFFHSLQGHELQKRFLDHALRGRGNWSRKQPPVTVYVRGADDSFEIRGERAWPIPLTRWTRLYLDAGELALTTTPPSRSSQVTYRARTPGVTFRMDPAAQEFEITGPLAATLHVSSSTQDADLFVNLRLFAPDGTEMLFRSAVDPKATVGYGWLRASHRKLDPVRSTPWRPYHTHDEKQPLQPGTVYELQVEIWPTSVVVPAGYVLAFTVAGQDFDHGLEPAIMPKHGTLLRGSGQFVHEDPEDRPAEVFANEVTILTGPDHPSSVLIPVIPR